MRDCRSGFVAFESGAYCLNTGTVYLMKSKNQSNYVEPYYQVPKIVAEFDKMTNDHIIIFMHLYEQLRQRLEWNKSNKELSILSRVGLTQLKYKLNDLESWGFLDRKGMTCNRKFSLGEKFNTRPESVPRTKTTRPVSIPNKAGMDTQLGRPAGYIDKNSFKNIINSSAHAIKTTKPKPKKSKFDRKPSAQEMQDYYHGKAGNEWVGEWRKEQGLL